MLIEVTDIAILAVIVVQFSALWHRLGKLEGKIGDSSGHCGKDDKDEGENET